MSLLRDRRSSGVLMFMALLLTWSAIAYTQTEPQEQQQPLLTNTPVEVEITGAKKIRYPLALTAGEFLQVRVTQKDTEILILLLDSGAKEVARMSSPKVKDGLETLSFVAAESGSYTVEVGLVDVKAGKGTFTIWREPARVATSVDRRRAELERVLVEGMAARDSDSETALRKLSTARNGYRELNDQRMVEMSELLLNRFQGRYLFFKTQKQLNEAKEPSTYRDVRISFLNAAELFRKGDQAYNEGAALLGAAVASQALGELESTINLIEMSLPAFSTEDTRLPRANLLDLLATFYLNFDDVDTALNYSMQSRSIYIELNRTEDAARIENAIGELHLQIGKFKESYPFLESSRKRREKTPACGFSSTLTNLAMYYFYANDKAKAREFLLDRALPLYPAGTACAGDKAKTLIVIGQFFYDLGSTDLALRYLSEAETSLEAEAKSLANRNANEFDIQVDNTNHKRKMATRLNVVGAAKFALAQSQEASISLSKTNSEKAAEARINAKKLYGEARTAYEEALKLYREIADKQREATVMTNIGVVQSSAGEIDAALQTFEAALKVSRDNDHTNAEAITLNNIGKVHSNRGEHRKALEYFNQSLPLFRAVEDKSGEAVALSYVMYEWARLGNRRMAIFRGKQAINIFQELRRGARGLNTEIQKDYLRGIREPYQRLAELLIEDKKNDLAVQILHLYQDQQFFDLDRKAPVEQANFSTKEADWVQRYELESKALIQLNSQIEDAKRRRITNRAFPEKVRAEMQALKADFTRATHVFTSMLEESEKESTQPTNEAKGTADMESVSKMQGALDQLSRLPRPHKVVALYTLIGNDKFYVLLMTPREIKVFTQDVRAEELNGSIIKTLADLQNPGFPEKILVSSSNLYNTILRTTSTQNKTSTLEAELERLKPDTLLWSLDGILSYLPVAALYDGKKSQYLLEKYQNVVFTRAAPERILRSKPPWETAIGFGKSTASNISCDVPCEAPPCDNSLKALTRVEQELAGISRRMRGDRAIVESTIVLNESFTQERMLQARNNPLVHIASHFCFQPGSAAESFLLLGNDKKFSLQDMSTHVDLYTGVDLLVLSACRTAALERNQMGKEIDSLAELSQRLGAASVIATLWNADEVGASRLMIRFYALHKRWPGLSKAELLRQAQLSLLSGNQTEPDINLDHPYYWAPFVLYGSFR